MKISCCDRDERACRCSVFDWYVAAHQPGKRLQAEVEIGRHGLEAFSPMERIVERVQSASGLFGGTRSGRRRQRVMRDIERDVPMFPGYVFVGVGAGAAAPVSDGVRFLTAMLCGAGEAPVNIPTTVMHEIFRANHDRVAVTAEQILFAVGDIVTVTSGPFQSLGGEVSAVDGSDGVTVMLDILGAIRGISMSTGIVAKNQ